ncbi:sugar-binding transcriptional regulator [Streptomonospora wellingtoniae]|uniref:Sugar-binding domain-containing protein n=1 Tax=Streptomonospora wellingtoniae TaxID=3075544 RepID=A0ABU2KU38_9ACTN|nr:sugar-binding domain-containing protein [Streptomonospora sp. DSM 45055]MDT0302588.1 sugar-binding domain-containing protein [Streptomonospora sp. DSM 45055]
MVLVSTVARRFYLDGRSKVEIAEEFGVSRFKVARALDTARESGIVRISIRVPARIDPDLSDRLRAAFGLERAIVVDGSEDAAETHRQLGAVAADLLAEIVEDDDVLGFAWGRTVNAVGAELTRLAHCTTVQLGGVVSHRTYGEDASEGSVESVRRAAQLSGGSAYPIYAPLILPDATTARALRSDPGIAGALTRFDRLTKAVVSIGGWDEQSSTVYSCLDPGPREELRERGVRAEISAQLFDSEGTRVHSELDERVLAITDAQLARVPEVIAVAGGPGKTEAIGVVLRSGLISTLVTDADTAQELLG